MNVKHTIVRFYDTAPDEALKFAVILAKHQGKWVFCKHRKRETWEIPGGHREPGEAIEQTARRELYEETGAVDYTIDPLFVYSVTAPWNFDGQETFGMVFFADIAAFEPKLHSEIERIIISDEFPTAWTYPEIQPRMLEEYFRRASITTSKEDAAKTAGTNQAMKCGGSK